MTDGVATLTLNRPETMNALSIELKEALLAALTEVGCRPSVRAVVLTGNGRGFCVGQDLAEHVQLLEAGDPAPLSTVEQHYNPITLALAELAKPVVAAVNGTAAGAGASFAFACDLRVVSEQAKFLLAFANVGLSLDSGASWTLPRLIGAGRATELCLLAAADHRTAGRRVRAGQPAGAGRAGAAGGPGACRPVRRRADRRLRRDQAGPALLGRPLAARVAGQRGRSSSTSPAAPPITARRRSPS